MEVEGAHVAQSVEHVLGKDEVTRSIRVVGSTGYGGHGINGPVSNASHWFLKWRDRLVDDVDTGAW
jgi:hypothetical protein